MRHAFIQRTAAMAVAGTAGLAVHADVVTLAPAADATIYSASNGIEQAANGGGAYLFAGLTTRFGERRALLRFDIASVIPASARIQEARLALTAERTISVPAVFRVHRVTASWNEGPSVASGQEGGGAEPLAGDVTWNFREFGPAAVAWATPGGDFAALHSSELEVDLARVEFVGAGLAQDVQAWLDTPATNDGWILRVATFDLSSVRRFISRENVEVAERPALVVRYTVPCVDLDFNNNEVTPEDQDVIDYFDVLAGAVCAACDGLDFNGNGVTPEDQDIIDFLQVLAGGDCAA